MYLVSIDFSKNNLLTEQLNVRSFYGLQVMNCYLTELQLKNFSDIQIDVAYITDCENKFDYQLFDVVNIETSHFKKLLFSLKADDNIILFRNDVYFEVDLSNSINNLKSHKVICLQDEKGFCFAVSCTVKTLINLHNKGIDFSELFLNYKKFADDFLTFNSYIKILNNVNSYKCVLFDILNRKTSFHPPYIAEGVFTEGRFPKGDFSIVPPVYLGENIQIESGSVIGPNTIIYNNTLISKESSIKNSVLFENVFISSNCFVDGSVCCENSSVKRNSAVFSGSVIGANSLVGEDITIENNSIIRKNVRYDKFIKSPFNNKPISNFKDKFQGLRPDKATLLGSAVATVFNKPKVLVAGDGSFNSLSIKLAFLSGFIASGGECFDVGTTFQSHIFFCSSFCECDYAVYFTGNSSGTNVEIFNSDNKPLNNAECVNLFDYCNKGKFVFVNVDGFKTIRQLHGMKRVYIREVTALFDRELDFNIIVDCKNPLLYETLNELFKKIGIKDKSSKKVYVSMNDSGTSVSIKYKEKVYTQRDLRRVVFFYLKSKKNCVSSETDMYQNIWKSDSVYLLFVLLNIINISEQNIEEIISDLPDFYINKRYVKCSLKKGERAKFLSGISESFYKNDRYNIALKNGLVKIEDLPGSDHLKILCASENYSFSNELCAFFEDFLGGLNT